MLKVGKKTKAFYLLRTSLSFDEKITAMLKILDDMKKKAMKDIDHAEPITAPLLTQKAKSGGKGLRGTGVINQPIAELTILLDSR
eukprot:UN22577